VSAVNDRRRRSDGERTHAAILAAATQLASIEGLSGLTIGRLAEVTGISKSGLYAHFGSKEQLERETIEAAQAVIQAEVLRPALEAPDGLRRLEALCEAYFSYVERLVFPGGCFMASLLAEMDARSGPIHDLVVSLERGWVEYLVELVREVQRLREIKPEIDARQLAFELDACLELTNYHFVLFRDPSIIRRGRRAARGILERATQTEAHPT
jgi:AcrR family transcriptional regulator